MDLDLIGKIIAAVGAVFGGSRYIYIKLLKPAYLRRVEKEKQAKEAYKQALEAASQIEIVINEIRAVKKQVMPNGGSSLADSLNRIENKFKEIDDKIDNQQEENRIFNNMQGKAFWESDKYGYTYYVSPSLCKMVERSESELLGLTWLSCLINSDAARISAEWKRAIEEIRPFDEIYTYKGIEGDIKVHATAFPKKDKNQHYTGSIGELSINTI